VFSLFVEGMLCNEGNMVGYPESFQYDTLPKPKNFMPRIKKQLLTDWFENHTASWNNRYKPEFEEILTRRGYGFAFNMLPKSQLFTDKYDV
jgi:hypothetical protein